MGHPFSDQLSRLPVYKAIEIVAHLKVYSFLSRESGVNMFCFCGDSKLGFAKLTLSVTWRYTTSYVTKIILAEVGVGNHQQNTNS